MHVYVQDVTFLFKVRSHTTTNDSVFFVIVAVTMNRYPFICDIAVVCHCWRCSVNDCTCYHGIQLWRQKKTIVVCRCVGRIFTCSGFILFFVPVSSPTNIREETFLGWVFKFKIDLRLSFLIFSGSQALPFCNKTKKKLILSVKKSFHNAHNRIELILSTTQLFIRLSGAGVCQNHMNISCALYFFPLGVNWFHTRYYTYYL